MTLPEIFDMVLEAIKLPVSYLMNTGKRIHILYLLSSMALAYYVYRRSNYKFGFFKYLFPKKIWLSDSAFVDYHFVFFNSFVKVFLIGPYLIFGFYLSFRTTEFLIVNFGASTFSLSSFQTILGYTIALTIIGDFTVYIVHALFHKFEFLWEFHKIHHSATTLNPITQYRIHPIELIINNIRATVVFGLLMGIFDYFSYHQVDKLLFLGANVFSFAFLFFGANLRHSHVQLKYFSFLEYIFLSPFQHQIHHSDNPAHYNKNMGSKLAIWDWLFGTLVISKSIKKLTFGIGKENEVFYDSFVKNLYMPFVAIFERTKRDLFGGVDKS